MADFATFVTTVYVFVDRLAPELPAEPPRVGRPAALTRSEVLTLALVAQLGRFSSERDFYRFASHCLRPLFPGLPDRSQLHRAFKRVQPVLVELGHRWAAALEARSVPYEVIDGTALPLRTNGRRGGVITDFTARGKSTRLGWVIGCRLLVTTTPTGIITGTAVAPANAHDSTLAETFFHQRALPDPATAMVGAPASGRYLGDSGFAGRIQRARWAAVYAAVVEAPPQANQAEHWPRPQRRWHARARQIVETVIGRLLQGMRLERERPRTLLGLLTRLAAKVALHNCCILWNRQCGQPDLAFESVIGW